MKFDVEDIQDRIIEGKRLLGNLSNPRRDTYPMLFDLTIEKGTCLTAVFSAIRVIKDSICMVSFSNRSIIEQPERMRVFKDFNLYNSRGRLLRLVHVVFQPPIFTKLVPHCLKYKVEEPLEVINRDLFALC